MVVKLQAQLPCRFSSSGNRDENVPLGNNLHPTSDFLTLPIPTGAWR